MERTPARLRFQYQKGAIKTEQHLPWRQPQRHQFQYQKGAIKTRHDGGRPAAHSDFNTKKVRLKHHLAYVVGDTIDHFNTKKVRLKLLGKFVKRAHDPSFQYQKGAIKTLEGVLVELRAAHISIPKRCD